MNQVNNYIFFSYFFYKVLDKFFMIVKNNIY